MAERERFRVEVVEEEELWWDDEEEEERMFCRGIRMERRMLGGMC